MELSSKTRKQFVFVDTYRCYYNVNHNYNKILKSDWFSTALISAFITSTLKSLAIRAI